MANIWLVPPSSCNYNLRQWKLLVKRPKRLASAAAAQIGYLAWPSACLNHWGYTIGTISWMLQGAQWLKSFKSQIDTSDAFQDAPNHSHVPIQRMSFHLEGCRSKCWRSFTHRSHHSNRAPFQLSKNDGEQSYQKSRHGGNAKCCMSTQSAKDYSSCSFQEGKIQTHGVLIQKMRCFTHNPCGYKASLCNFEPVGSVPKSIPKRVQQWHDMRLCNIF